MSLRIMLPSRARVGDTVHFAFPNGRDKTITAFEVKINGKKIEDPVITTNRAPNGVTSNFVFKAKEPGHYQFMITPITESGEKCEPRFNTLEVSGENMP
jgi:hypothetical protein